MLIKFDNTYARLPGNFYQALTLPKFPNPELVYFNTKLADELGIKYNIKDINKVAEILSGNDVPNSAEPIALAYAGHQYGKFVPQLGDGRAILLGEILNKNGSRFDVQLKGSGATIYSRGGDGKAALGPMIREYIISEAMNNLGIKTTRSLAVVSSGEKVIRNGEMLSGAILTRIAASHIRIGTFEYFASRGDVSYLQILANYTINRHYPEIKNEQNLYLSFFEKVRDKQIELIVNWMRIGFIHGVMNTDNVAISGESLDFGPCAFLDEYNPNKVFSSIDYYGRYSFANQANICYWNLSQLARCIALLTNSKESLELLINALEDFKIKYQEKYTAMLYRKIGIVKFNSNDQYLIEELLDIMHKEEIDYTLTFRYLSYLAADKEFDYGDVYIPSISLNKWIEKWFMRLIKENNSFKEISNMMLKENPAIIPRNHQIEKTIKYAVEHQDFTKGNYLLQALSNPYDIKHEQEHKTYIVAPKQNERVCKTFCGT